MCADFNLRLNGSVEHLHTEKSLALAKSNDFDLPWHPYTKMLLTHTLLEPSSKVHAIHPLEQAHWVDIVL